MTGKHVVVIGAGMGGLSAALDLAASGIGVTLLERHAAPGGKMRQVSIGDARIDSGPTVFTMRWVFEDLFEAAGTSLSSHVELSAAEVLARHSWLDGTRLDLFADVERSVDAIATLAGAREAAAYRDFASQSQRIFETLDHTFMRRERPSAAGLTVSLGFRGLPRLYATKPFATLWRELGRVFRDPRLRQLFGRYATYCGSSPFAAPATLMLIAHAERAGVWLVEGGMQGLASALLRIVERAGASIRLGTEAVGLRIDGGRVSGVDIAGGDPIQADAVIFNGDVAALTAGLLGDGAVGAVARRPGEPRSLSALTWSTVAVADGFPLEHHSVFFGGDYADEFASIFSRQAVCAEPTVYVCAQGRSVGNRFSAGTAEPLFVLINAPPRAFDDREIGQLQARVRELLARHGLRLTHQPGGPVVTTPADFDRLFPGSGGSIYGWPTHGAMGTFRRSGSRAKIPGLYLAGGTVHPGPGVPMAALSGRIAAASVRADLAG